MDPGLAPLHGSTARASRAVGAGVAADAGAGAGAWAVWPRRTLEAVAPNVGQRTTPSVSCVVPCFNEADNLDQLLPRLGQTLDACTPDWEIVLVDDGSTDRSPLVQARWARQPHIRVLQLSRNFGKEAALTAGLLAAAGEVVVTMDADLQHSPALIPTFLDKWRAGADVVYAVRETRADEPALKRLGTRLFYALLKGADRFEVPPGAGDFRLMDRTVVDALLALPERNRFMKGLYAWVGFESVAVPYVPEPRAHGRSHFSLPRLVHLSLDGLTSFTTWPLRAVSVLGFSLALLALSYGLYLTVSYFHHGHQVNGWTTIVVSLMLFSGIQLISLGIVGEYVGRVFEEVKARPLFVVKRDLGSGLQGKSP
ncbi:MAG: glycosyltransferase family 2 protein [Rhizobacter sp.]|nr:glycosyltransferase family 2 protein [Rhizobacter sp.]